MGNLDIYFLLLAAVIAGWLLGRFGWVVRHKAPASQADIFDDYFVGLNYLLNDEPDEAIDTFINALEINSDTIETHLALGALLRRRGKVDKAIQVHQSLLARPGFTENWSNATRLQLAMDYIAAGLLDRAERLLNEIIDEGSSAQWDAIKHLITIYQTEKEWEKAISCVSKMLGNSAYKKDTDLRKAAAHYCCQLAEKFLLEQQNNKAIEQVKRAFTFDRKSVRAAMLLAELELRRGNFKAAKKGLMAISESNPDTIHQLLKPMQRCFEELGSSGDYEEFLTSLFAKTQDVGVLRELAELISNRSGSKEALDFFTTRLNHNSSMNGLLELLRLQILSVNEAGETGIPQLQDMLEEFLLKRTAYQCNHCGYESKNSYWLCPSCKKWDTIKPISETGGY